MSWKVHETDEVFAELRGLCSNSYRMYDTSEYRYYYDHECDAYECAVEDAAREYERLLKHCANQREQLAKLNDSQTIDILMELLNEYRESGCALDEDRVTDYAYRLDGRTVNERWINGGRTEEGAAMSITDELREAMDPCISDDWLTIPKSEFETLADRIDAEHERMYEDLTIGMEPMTEANMARDGWVKLPVDADGVPIHVGDELTNGTDLPAKVRCMVLDESGWMVSTRELRGYGMPPATLRHVQPDSWERIIKDAQEYVTDDEPLYSVSELVERCRRLAGEAE